jgi:hypothetical protein
LGGEIFFPTGEDEEGFGRGTTFVEPYIAIGQLLPADFFIQGQAGAGLPFDSDKAEEEAFWRLVFGRSFYQQGYGRRWTPMIELLGDRELKGGAEEQWDLAPQLQVTLSRRQHVRLGVGAQVPLNNRDERNTQYNIYLLWDWFDGGFFEGW